jgi:TonB family protein
VFATLLFPLIAIGLAAGTIVLIVPLFALIFWIAMRMFFAWLMGNTVLVSKLNYPRIDAITEEMKARLGYDKRVYVFVYESPSFNASLLQFFFRRAICLNSEILEQGVSDDEVRWLVGRFVGYLRTRKQAGALGWLIRAAQKLLIFNLFLLPYERAMVYTGDRLAVAAIGGDIASAISALQKVFVGRQLGYSVNPEGIIGQQRQISRSFFAFLARLTSGFPFMTMRYVDLMVFAKAYFPAQYARFVAANPGMPDDLPRLAATSEKPVPALDGHTRVKSGIPLGWVTSALTFAALVLGIFVVAPRLMSAVAQARSFDSSSLSADAQQTESNPAVPDSPPAGSGARDDGAAAAAQSTSARTGVALDPAHPILLDDFYPPESKQAGEQGRCVVQMTVGKDGIVTQQSIVTGSGFPRLDRACLASVHGQHLIPATENGKPIEDVVSMPIDWKLR